VISDSPQDILSENVEGRNIEDFYRRTPEGMPEHQLKLKIGAIMMVIRNVNTNDGIANGTRVQIVKLMEDTVICRHIDGALAGETFPLARFRFKYGGTVEDATTYGGVEWERLQFPLRPGFVMTINKAQGKLSMYAMSYIYIPNCLRPNFGPCWPVCAAFTTVCTWPILHGNVQGPRSKLHQNLRPEETRWHMGQKHRIAGNCG
jgi:hypothetical protein